jgi:hypothetical protein
LHARCAYVILHQSRLGYDVYAFERLVGDPLGAEATCLVNLAVQLLLGARKGKVLAYCLSVGQLEAVEGELIRRLGPGVAGEVEVFQCHARDGAMRERVEEAFKVDAEGAANLLGPKGHKGLVARQRCERCAAHRLPGHAH